MLQELLVQDCSFATTTESRVICPPFRHRKMKFGSCLIDCARSQRLSPSLLREFENARLRSASGTDLTSVGMSRLDSLAAELTDKLHFTSHAVDRPTAPERSERSPGRLTIPSQDPRRVWETKIPFTTALTRSPMLAFRHGPDPSPASFARTPSGTSTFPLRLRPHGSGHRLRFSGPSRRPQLPSTYRPDRRCR
ncbi:hypothetical protein GY45DRAFT_915193 [Cubamyces sp. BRFM 1775]|nr:hypothetical protein GY45DRAFT_915193 [Cubamyces sp. BRFM 1775]